MHIATMYSWSLVGRLMQTVNRSLRRSSATYNELSSIIVEIESVINCRPLCYTYSDEVDEVLTPSHLVIGWRLILRQNNYPTEIYEDSPRTLNHRVTYLNTLLPDYKKRWITEYLTDLREFQRSNNRVLAKQLKIGDIVLIEEDGLPRSRWRLCKVHEVFISKDGYVRGCKLRVMKIEKLNLLIDPLSSYVSSKFPQMSDGCAILITHRSYIRYKLIVIKSSGECRILPEILIKNLLLDLFWTCGFED